MFLALATGGGRTDRHATAGRTAAKEPTEEAAAKAATETATEDNRAAIAAAPALQRRKRGKRCRDHARTIDRRALLGIHIGFNCTFGCRCMVCTRFNRRAFQRALDDPALALNHFGNLAFALLDVFDGHRFALDRLALHFGRIDRITDGRFGHMHRTPCQQGHPCCGCGQLCCKQFYRHGQILSSALRMPLPGDSGKRPIPCHAVDKSSGRTAIALTTISRAA